MTIGKLLINETPLQVLPSLAELVGLNEAMLLQQIHYWLQQKIEDQRDIHNGRPWVYNSYEDLTNKFRFWSYNTIRRTIKSLEDKGVLLSSEDFNRYKQDRTKWYTIDYDKLEELFASAQNGQSTCHNDSPPAQNGQSESPNWAGDDLPKMGKPLPKNPKNQSKEGSSSSTMRMRDPLDPNVQRLSQAYEKYFGIPGNYTLIDWLLTFVDDGMTVDLIVRVFHYARENGKRYDYAKSTIVNLFNDKIFTVDQFEAQLAAWEEAKAARQQAAAGRESAAGAQGYRGGGTRHGADRKGYEGNAGATQSEGYFSQFGGLFGEGVD